VIGGAESTYPFVEGDQDIPADVVPTPRNLVRKHCYRTYTYYRYGHLGKGNRVMVPSCVSDKIRERWPEENDDDFMGFREE